MTETRIEVEEQALHFAGLQLTNRFVNFRRPDTQDTSETVLHQILDDQRDARVREVELGLFLWRTLDRQDLGRACQVVPLQLLRHCVALVLQLNVADDQLGASAAKMELVNVGVSHRDVIRRRQGFPVFAILSFPLMLLGLRDLRVLPDKEGTALAISKRRARVETFCGVVRLAPEQNCRTMITKRRVGVVVKHDTDLAEVFRVHV